jgi:hypothetical protein
MLKKKVKYNSISIRLTPDEVKALKRVQSELKRRTITDTLRFLVLRENELFLSQK